MVDKISLVFPKELKIINAIQANIIQQLESNSCIKNMNDQLEFCDHHD